MTNFQVGDKVIGRPGTASYGGKPLDSRPYWVTRIDTAGACGFTVDLAFEKDGHALYAARPKDLVLFERATSDDVLDRIAYVLRDRPVTEILTLDLAALIGDVKAILRETGR